MKNNRLPKISIFISLLTVFFSQTLLANDQNQYLNIHHWSLKNKTQVFFIQRNQIPMLDVAVVFKAGSLYDGNQLGISALTSKMIGQGTKKLSADAVANRFDSVGAIFKKFLNRDMSVYTLRTLVKSDVLSKSLSTFKDVLLTPRFSSSALSRQKKYMITELNLEKENPWDIAKNALYKTIYKEFPYGNNPSGSIKSINRITVKNIQQFYSRYFVGSNAALILVGDISIDQAKKTAQTLLGKIPVGKKAKQFKVGNKVDKSNQINIYKKTHQTTIMVGQLAVKPYNQQYYSLLVGNAVLGGLPMSSILYDNIREKNGLAYFVSSGFSSLFYRGLFILGLQTKASNQQAAISLLQHSLTGFLKNGPTEKQLNDAKKYLKGNFPITISSNKSLVNLLIRTTFYGFPLDFIDNYEKNIQAVSIKSVKEAFNKIININHLTYVVVGPNHGKKLNG